MNSSNSQKPNVLTLENLRKILYKNDKEETEASENSNDVETTKAVNKNQFEFIKSHFGSLKEYIFLNFSDYEEAKGSLDFAPLRNKVSEFMNGKKAGLKDDRNRLCQLLSDENPENRNIIFKCTSDFWKNCDLKKQESIREELLKLIQNNPKVYSYSVKDTEKTVYKGLDEYVKNIKILLIAYPVQAISWLLIGAALQEEIFQLKPFYTIPYLSLKNIYNMLYDDASYGFLFTDYSYSGEGVITRSKEEKEKMLHPEQSVFLSMFLHTQNISDKNTLSCMNEMDLSEEKSKNSISKINIRLFLEYMSALIVPENLLLLLLHRTNLITS